MVYSLLSKMYDIPYPRHCSPGVLFFNMGFWVGVNSKNPPKSGLFKQKVGVYSRKTPKTRLFTLPGAQFKSGAAMTRIRYFKKHWKKVDSQRAKESGIIWQKNLF